MKVIRFFVGRLILFLDWVTAPKPVKRAPDQQQLVDATFQDHSLYQFKACPFCVKVRRYLKKQNVQIPYVDAKTDPFRTELLQSGGKVKVPCLKIQETKADEPVWLYESNDIIAYFEERLPR